nr:hypothetical protein [Prolixibacteraceae bacterium]
QISTTPPLSTKDLENLPAWSPCGRFLYYISAPALDAESDATVSRYSLLRIGYNPDTNEWLATDTLLCANETGLSITYPTPSPDGKYLAFCMANNGYFTVHNPTADLYLMNLETKAVRKLPVNSGHVESYLSWSSNGRWLMFVSKRLDGLYSRPYFSWVDTLGNTAKPYLLPQKDPGFYDRFTSNFNRPVFLKDKVRLAPGILAESIRQKPVKVSFDPSVDVSALSGATRILPQSGTGHGQ